MIDPINGINCTVDFSDQMFVDEYSYWVDIDVIGVDANTVDIIVVDQQIRRLEGSDNGFMMPMNVPEHSDRGGRLLRVRVDLPTG